MDANLFPVLSLKKARKKSRKSLASTEISQHSESASSAIAAAKTIKDEVLLTSDGSTSESTRKSKKKKMKEDSHEIFPQSSGSAESSPNKRTISRVDDISDATILSPTKKFKKQSPIKEHAQLNEEIPSSATQVQQRISGGGQSLQSDIDSGMSSPVKVSQPKETGETRKNTLEMSESDSSEEDDSEDDDLASSASAGGRRVLSDEVNSPARKFSSQKVPKTPSRRAKSLRYTVPPGCKQVPFKQDVVNDNDSEVWLLKVPQQFSFDQLQGVKCISDVASICVHNSKSQHSMQDKDYQWEMDVKSMGDSQTSDVTVLLPTLTRNLTPAGPLKGVMSVRRTVKTLPTIPPEPRTDKHVKMPEGLRWRNVPFGSSCPVITSTKAHVKKKKNKKSKKSAADMPEEDASTMLTGDTNEKHKKKKKKKDKS